MRFRADDRGASVQIGAILLFAMLIVAVAGWQAQVVPQDNAEVEYTHSQRVTDDMQDVRNEIVSAPGRTSLRSVAVEVAPSYPPRTIFVNPGQPDGTLRTVGTTDRRFNVTVANAEATDDETADYWDGTARDYNTGALRYEPGYNVYTGAPDTVYENTVLYDAHDDGTTVTVAGQDLVEGRTVTLVALNGSLTRTAGGTYSVDLEALSSSSRTVSVTDAGGNITVSFASGRDPAWWEDRLRAAEEFTDQDGYVFDVRPGSPATVGEFHNVTVELAGGETYRLEMAKVGVGSRTEGTGAAYVTDVEGDGGSVQSGGTRRLVVEVRDEYNNPVSGVTVANNTTGSVLGGGSLDAESKTTGDDGRATFELTAGTGDAAVQFNVSDDATPLARELVTFHVGVTGSGGDSTGPGTSNVQASPGGPYLAGDTFTLSADVSDVERGGTQLLAAEWYRNTSGDPGTGNANAMAASDGSFDTVEESVDDSVDTTGWSAGDHELFVRGKDANGNWGPEEGVVVTVSSGSPPSVDSSSVQFTGNCNGPNNDVEYEVEWEVSDPDGDLDQVTVTLEDSLGSEVDSAVTAVSGGAANNLGNPDVLSDTGGCGTTYTITVTVTDQTGNTDSQSTTDVAN